MPKQNRVTPYGDIISRPERGLFTGNRGGELHNGKGEIVDLYTNRSWIICVLEFKDRQATVMAPGAYTHLFFLDEVTALAAGHRPCFECRRLHAVAYVEAWMASQGVSKDGKPTSVTVIDEQLQRERLTEDHFKKDKAKVTYRESYARLPDGVLVEVDKTPHLLWHRQLYLWSPAGYGAPIPIPETPTVTVLTPKSTVGAIAYGYRPVVHESAL